VRDNARRGIHLRQSDGDLALAAQVRKLDVDQADAVALGRHQQMLAR
jgi:hypothetical protein